MSDIRTDIEQLLDDGVDMDDILVNDNDNWGERCAVSREDAEECAAQWDPPGDLNDLTPAFDWLIDNPEETTT